MKAKITALAEGRKRTGRRLGRKDRFDLFTLAIPGLLFLMAFYYVPMYGLVIPFKSINYSKGIWGSDWNGFKNFEFFFKSQDSWRITRNTIGLNLIFIFTTLVISIVLAIMLFELTGKYVKLYQTMLFLPYFVSWIVVSYILYAFISPSIGFIPKLLAEFGIETPNYYYELKIWPWILTGAYVWKNVGYMTLLFYASLMSIDTSYFEAAAIDGASKMQQIRYISLPHLKPIIIMMTLLQIGKIFYADFGLFYFLTRNVGALYEVTDVIDTYVYRALRVTGDLGMSAAAGLYQSIVGFFLVLISNLIVKRIDPDQALF